MTDATAGPADLDLVRGLGAEMAVNYKTTKFEDAVPPSIRYSTRSEERRSIAGRHPRVRDFAATA
jgi:hypothetical protein